MDQVSMHTASGSAAPMEPMSPSTGGGFASGGEPVSMSMTPESGMEAMISASSDATRIVRDVQMRELMLTGPDLADADGVVVTMPAGMSLCYNMRGELAASHRHEPDEEDISIARAHVAHLVREDKIHFARPGESVSPAALAAAGKPFYVEIDDDGRKRLRRSYFA